MKKLDADASPYENPMKSKEIQRHYWDLLSTSERLLRSLAEQSAALTLHDTHRVESIQPELEMLLGRLQTIDEKVAISIQALAASLGVHPTMRSIVEKLNSAEARQVEALSNRVLTVSKNVKEKMAMNRRLIESELEYMAGTMAIVAHAVQENQGKFAVASGGNLTLNQVA